MTSAFLLVRDSVAPLRAVSRRLSLAGAFFAFPLAGATGAACGAGSGNRRATACQIRATAALRLVNFFTGFKSSNGATPAKLFQVSTSREAGHSAVSLASSFGVENDCDSSAPAGSPVSAVMLLSESIVNVDTVSFSFAALAVMTSITPVGSKGKAIPQDAGGNLSSERKRALDSHGRAWRCRLVVATELWPSVAWTR